MATIDEGSRSRILALTGDLWTDRHRLVMDEVDGAFYWRVCRYPSFPDVADFRDSSFPRDTIMQWFSEYPDWLVSTHENAHPRLRSAWARVLHGGTGGNPNFQGPGKIWVGVPRRDWRGSDFAAFVKEWDRKFEAISPAKRESMMPRLDGQHFNRGIGMIFGFEEADSIPIPTPWDQREDGLPTTALPTIAFPCVIVEIQYPLPPTSVLEAVYDAYAIEMHQLHLRLPDGRPNNQTIPVAIRTWAAACLIANGAKPYRAFGDVAEVTDEEFPSERTFYENKSQLLERVPEADRFLSVRGKRFGIPQ